MYHLSADPLDIGLTFPKAIKYYKYMNVKKSAKTTKNALPLYSRVESIIRNKIINGQLQPSEMLPKEQDLAAQFDVSQITVRTALSHLKDEGLIVRSRAKGTFVADSVPLKNQHFIKFNDVYDIVRNAAQYQVKTIDSKTTTVRKARYPQDVAKFLKFSFDNEICILRRIRLLKNNPIMFLENYMPIQFAEHVNEKDLSQKPLLKTLKDKIGLSVGRGEFFMEAIPAEPDIAEILMIELFEPLISMKIYYWLSSGEPFEVVNMFMRADYLKYKGTISAEHFKDI